MKIEYLLNDEAIYSTEGDNPPSVGSTIFLKEVFYVEEVVWYPETKVIRIYLTDELAKKEKVAESKGSVLKLQDINKVQSTANKALKEVDNLKRQVFSIRQYLKTRN
jgi:hypothetical protein